MRLAQPGRLLRATVVFWGEAVGVAAGFNIVGNGDPAMGHNPISRSSVPKIHKVIARSIPHPAKTLAAVSSGPPWIIPRLGNSWRPVSFSTPRATCPGIAQRRRNPTISAGQYHPLALAVGATRSIAFCSEGTSAAWGDNTNGQLGNNSKSASSSQPFVDTGSLDGMRLMLEAGGAASGPRAGDI